MRKWIFRILFLGIGGFSGYKLVSFLFPHAEVTFWPRTDLMISKPSVIGLVLGAGIGFTVLPLAAEHLLQLFLKHTKKLEIIPIQDVVAGSLGLILGLIIGSLIVYAFPIDAIPGFGVYLRILINLATAYMGMNLVIRKREEFLSIFKRIPGGAKKDKGEKEFKILDTSVIIDGRIADICRSGFLEGTLIIPEFVLEELRHIADSPDLLKRNRGRRGLDILNRIQKDLGVEVEVVSTDYEELSEVDSKLVRLAQHIEGKIITNDFNLNKVAELQGVTVLNINELANAVKPIVLPGEEMQVKVIKEGKEYGQGVAYLDDGTMIVVDEGRKYIGDQLEVLVTSILQTAAGRMIFAKPKVEGILEEV